MALNNPTSYLLFIRDSLRLRIEFLPFRHKHDLTGLGVSLQGFPVELPAAAFRAVDEFVFVLDLFCGWWLWLLELRVLWLGLFADDVGFGDGLRDELFGGEGDWGLGDCCEFGRLDHYSSAEALF